MGLDVEVRWRGDRWRLATILAAPEGGQWFDVGLQPDERDERGLRGETKGSTINGKMGTK